MRISKSNISAIAWLLLVASFAAFLLFTETTQKQTTMKPLGVVLQVKECHSGKHSHTCSVLTSTHQWDTDLGNWPGEILQTGDQLSMRTDQSRGRRETWLCRNGLCRSLSICWSWMPCWDRRTLEYDSWQFQRTASSRKRYLFPIHYLHWIHFTITKIGKWLATSWSPWMSHRKVFSGVAFVVDIQMIRFTIRDTFLEEMWVIYSYFDGGCYESAICTFLLENKSETNGSIWIARA